MERIEDYRTPNGGFTRATAERFGYGWPPPKRWVQAQKKKEREEAIRRVREEFKKECEKLGIPHDLE